ncbi:MAG: AraC family transcriptional regulator [Pseudomonadota bacterium]
MASVHTARFRSEALPQAKRLAALHDVTSAIYEPRLLHDEPDFAADALRFQLNDLVFTDLTCSATRFIRDQRHLAGGGEEPLVLQAQYFGEELLVMQHGIMRLLPDHIYLRDWAYPFESLVEDMHIRSIAIPRRLLSASSMFNLHNPIMSWSRSEAPGRLLWELWSLLFEELERVDIATAESLSEGFLSFLDALITPGEHAIATHKPTLDTMEQFLQQQLRGDIGVGALSDRFGVSRATVFRLFKPHGGVDRYIDRQRLDRCLAELKSADPSRTTVGYIAAGWGYLDPADFRRRFRRLFGVSPSTVLGSDFAITEGQPNEALKKPAAPALHLTYKRWLRNVGRSGV